MSSGLRWLPIVLAVLLSPLPTLTPEQRTSNVAAAPDAPERTELASTGWARLKGEVTYDGGSLAVPGGNGLRLALMAPHIPE